jgi:hypothetical protein
MNVNSIEKYSTTFQFIKVYSILKIYWETVFKNLKTNC